MSQPSPFEKPIAVPMGMKYADMTRRQRLVFVAKLLVCIATFGYVFPNVQSE